MFQVCVFVNLVGISKAMGDIYTDVTQKSENVSQVIALYWISPSGSLLRIKSVALLTSINLVKWVII